jgi:hypothetical protein
VVRELLSFRRHRSNHHLVFLEAYLDYFQLHDIPRRNPATNSVTYGLRIATDNKGLIERITSEITTKIAFAGAALCAEYDVVHATVESNVDSPDRQWEHAKGTKTTGKVVRAYVDGDFECPRRQIGDRWTRYRRGTIDNRDIPSS